MKIERVIYNIFVGKNTAEPFISAKVKKFKRMSTKQLDYYFVTGGYDAGTIIKHNKSLHTLEDVQTGEKIKVNLKEYDDLIKQKEEINNRLRIYS